MKPFVAMTAVFAAASAAPADYAAVAPAAVAPAAVAHAPAAVGYAVAPAAAAPVVPAPYTTSEVRGAPIETVHQPPAQVRKEVHYGQTQFVSGYATNILKPATPVLPIAVPTVLKGTVSQNAPIVKAVKEPYVVNEPYTVEKRVERPYDVPVLKEQLVDVPVAVHVDRPYAVEHPVPVAGEPIVKYRQTAPVVEHHHTNVVAQPAVAVAQPAVAAVGYAAAAPAVGYAASPVAAVAAAPAAVGYAGYAAAAPVAAAATY